jgi:ribosomal protein RSM22 (predicted rRNA methylase)
VCGFSQRIQRPEFVRRTKHSGLGHEDIGYSYVVIRRGPRPAIVTTKAGRIGAIGQSALEKEAVPTKELRLHSDYKDAPSCEAKSLAELTSLPQQITNVQSDDALKEALRLEAFSWPRLVVPPLKRSGHVIIDSCTPEGEYSAPILYSNDRITIFRQDYATDNPKVTRETTLL